MFQNFPLILYHTPIEELNFSHQTTSYLLKNGILSIGDCLDFFLARKQKALEINNGEMLEILKKTDYWSIVADDSEL